MQSTITQHIIRRFARRKTPLAEVAAVTTGLATGTFRMAGYSADDLVGKQGLTVYDEMQKDAQVRACLNTKKFAVLSKGWDVLPADDSPSNIRSAEFAKHCLNDMKGSVQDALFKVLDALAKGFSICEVNWKIIRGGPYDGMVGLDSIKSKDPSAFGFDIDEFLNIRGLVMSSPAAKTNLPVDKFIIYTYMPEYELPYGQSDLRAAYKHWWSKEVILKFWNLYLEKFGMPTAKGSYRRGMPKEQQDDLLRVLDKIQQETAIVVPEDVQIELLEAQRGGEAGYQAAIEFHNRQIAKAVLGQTLTSDEGSRVGSLALAKVHLDVLYFYLQKLKRDLEETVMGEQVIRRLIDINFGMVNGRWSMADVPTPSLAMDHRPFPIRPSAIPRFVLGGMDDRDLEALGGLIERLITGKVIAPDEPWIRGYLGLPAA